MAVEDELQNIPTDLDDREEDMEVHDDAEVGKEVDVTPDKGVIKKILTKGTGWQQPEKGDEVFVHYVGTLASDGTKFDSSRDRGDPFKFTIGQGMVIKGWDLGVATMKKGEKALLNCKPEYAYGENGSPPTIPANATLNFEVELLWWKSVNDLAGDGGLIKTIQTEGEGWYTPKEKDEVIVSYKVKLSGKDDVVLESPEGNVAFTVKDGHLFKAMATAVKSMKKGEHVTLKLKPEYGFGDVGHGSAIPGGSSLDVELTLVDIRKVENVTDDGVVTKKTIKEGDSNDWKKPSDGAKCTVRYTLRLLGANGQGGVVVEERGEGNELEFTVDEEETTAGLDAAIQKIKTGEVALVTVGPQYGFGSKEQQLPLGVVPPNSTLVYEVELVAFEKAKETWEMNNDEKVEAALHRKEKGNKAYKEGKLERATRQYDQAVQVIQYDKDYSDDQKKRSKEVKKSCYLNLAQCWLKRSNCKEVCKNVEKVLEMDPMNVKAMYRRAQAYLHNSDFVEAELDIKKGLEVEPENSELQALYKRLKIVRKQQDKAAAKIFSKMFSALGGDNVTGGESSKPHDDGPSTSGKEECPADVDMKTVEASA